MDGVSRIRQGALQSGSLALVDRGADVTQMDDGPVEASSLRGGDALAGRLSGDPRRQLVLELHRHGEDNHIEIHVPGRDLPIVVKLLKVVSRDRRGISDKARLLIVAEPDSRVLRASVARRIRETEAAQEDEFESGWRKAVAS